MILSLFISFGFKENIKDKVRGFGSDIQLVNYDTNHSFDFSATSLDHSKAEKIEALPGVKSISGFITKPVILKYNNNIEGIILKSYQNKKHFDFFKSCLIKGHFPDFENHEFLISETISKALNLNIGESVILYFIQEPIRYRKLKVSGIYKTDVYEFDHIFALADIKMLQKINLWQKHEVSGYEINTNTPDVDQSVLHDIEHIIRPEFFNEEKETSILKALTAQERHPEFYQLFDFFNTNVAIIISLLIAVAAINLISALLIIIIENTTLVGLLKSFGAEKKTIRKIFFYFAAYLTIKGIIWGNIIAISISFLQYKFQLIPLSAKDYYISYVPIGFDWMTLLYFNLLSTLLIFCILIIPTNYISKISPIKVIRFN